MNVDVTGFHGDDRFVGAQHGDCHDVAWRTAGNEVNIDIFVFDHAFDEICSSQTVFIHAVPGGLNVVSLDQGTQYFRTGTLGIIVRKRIHVVNLSS